MKINLTPVFNFFTKYSRKARLKILLSVFGLDILGIILGIILAVCGASFLAGIVLQCVLYGIIAIPFLLLALIPKQQVEKSKEAPDIGKVVSTIKSEYKKNQRNSRPATQKERLLFGGILLLASGGCFWIGGIAILGGIFWLVMAIMCFIPSVPVKVLDKKKVNPRSVQSEHKEKKKGAFLGGIFVVVGFLVMGIITTGRFTCTKGVVQECEFQSKHLWELDYQAKSKLPLEDLKGAFVESKRGDNSTLYYVVLRTTNGEQNLFNSSSSSRSSHEKKAQKINQFLNSDQETLEIKESKVVFLIPLIFIVMGGFILRPGLTFLSKKSTLKK